MVRQQYLLFTCAADAPENRGIGFQDSATPTMEGIIDLHHDLCFFLVVIVVFIMWMLFRSVYLFTGSLAPPKLFHGATLELVWTLAPSLVLLCIAVPSFGLLYGMEALANPGVTIKAIGHQWYWSAPFHCGNITPRQLHALKSQSFYPYSRFVISSVGFVRSPLNRTYL